MNLRSLLAEELGVDPSPEAQQIYERILMQDEKLAVIRNLRPATSIHHRIMQRLANLLGLTYALRKRFTVALASLHRLIEFRNAFCRRHRLEYPSKMDQPSRHAAETLSGHSPEERSVEAGTCMRCLLQPAPKLRRTPPGNICRLKVRLREILAFREKLENILCKHDSRLPSLVNTSIGKAVRCAGPFANARVAVSAEERFAFSAGLLN